MPGYVATNAKKPRDLARVRRGPTNMPESSLTSTSENQFRSYFSGQRGACGTRGGLTRPGPAWGASAGQAAKE